MLYTALLDLHSVLRWVVLVAGVLAAVHVWRGGASGRAGLVFTAALDSQVMIGVVMYFAVSPIVAVALANMKVAMKDHTLRFWAVEHPTAMIIGLVLAHAARIVERRAGSDARKRRRAAILFTIAVVVIVLGVPWPFLPYGRPLFPGL